MGEWDDERGGVRSSALGRVDWSCWLAAAGLLFVTVISIVVQFAIFGVVTAVLAVALIVFDSWVNRPGGWRGRARDRRDTGWSDVRRSDVRQSRASRPQPAVRQQPPNRQARPAQNVRQQGGRPMQQPGQNQRFGQPNRGNQPPRPNVGQQGRPGQQPPRPNVQQPRPNQGGRPNPGQQMPPPNRGNQPPQYRQAPNPPQPARGREPDYRARA